MFNPCKAFDMALMAHAERVKAPIGKNLANALWRYERAAFNAMECWQENKQSPVAIDGALRLCRKLYYWSQPGSE